MKIGIVIYCTITLLILSARGQGAFQNLDFEAANISQGQAPGPVNTTDALPGWSAYVLYPQTQISFDDVNAATGIPQINLISTNGTGETSIEGNFSLFLQSGYITLPGGNSSILPVNITQTGLVPTNAESIIFKAQPGNASLVLSLNVQTIPFFTLATYSNYTLYGADISAFAGQVTDLAFTAGIYGTGWNLDSIEFSSQVVPEPSIWALFIAGSGLLVFSRRSRG